MRQSLRWYLTMGTSLGGMMASSWTVLENNPFSSPNDRPSALKGWSPDFLHGLPYQSCSRLSSSPNWGFLNGWNSLKKTSTHQDLGQNLGQRTASKRHHKHHQKENLMWNPWDLPPKDSGVPNFGIYTWESHIPWTVCRIYMDIAYYEMVCGWWWLLYSA